MTPDIIFEIVGACIGLIYLLLEYKANFWLWPVGIVMSLFYVIIFFQSHFYADAAVNMYYIGANVYGLALWKKNSGSADAQESMKICRVSKSLWPKLVAVALVLWLVLFLILKCIPNSASPAGDGFTTALSVVAMWMLAQKYVEQWLFWIAVDMVSVALYLWKGLYPTAVLYSVYTVIAVLGYFKWRRETINRALKDNV